MITLKNYLKTDPDLIKKRNDFEEKIDNFKNKIEQNVGKIFSCSDFDSYLQTYFSNICYDKENKKSVYSLFDKFVEFNYYFYDKRIKSDFYTEKISCSGINDKKFRDAFEGLIEFIGETIDKCVEDLQNSLNSDVTLTISENNISYDIIRDCLRQYLKTNNKPKNTCIGFAVMQKLTLKVSKDFSINQSNNGFDSMWIEKELTIAPELKYIIIEGLSKKVTLKSISTTLFKGIPKLEIIEFKNVKFNESIELAKLRNLLGVESGVKITIDNKSLESLIKEEQKKKKKKKQEEDQKE